MLQDIRQKNNEDLKLNKKEGIEPFILFQLAGTNYAIPSTLVQQMEMIESITPIPKAPEYVEGVVFSRGEVIPVVNLRVRLGFEKIEYNLKTRLIVINTQGRTVGLIVDSARDFILLDHSTFQDAPEAIADSSGKYLNGIVTVGDRLVLVVNVDAILNFATDLSQAGTLHEVLEKHQGQKF